MAECLNVFENKKTSDDENEEDKSEKSQSVTDELKSETIECSVCLGTAVFPILIPCGHVFCFLCIKGVVQQSNICPMCRQAVPFFFYKNPIFLEYPGQDQEDFHHDGYQWFYECRSGGWWQYEKRTSEEIEQNYQLNNNKFNLLICGTLYTIDLDLNMQYNVENPVRRRKLKRENGGNLLVRGIAGIYYNLYSSYF